MSFRFKLFKGLTGTTLFITGFFLLMNFTSMLMGAFGQGLVSIVMFGGVFIHSILSAYLQRSLQEPGFTLKENTPGGIRIMGGYSILIGSFLIIGAVAISVYKDLYMKEVSAQMSDEQIRQLDSMKGLMDKVITGMQIFLFLYGAAIITNALLSLSFLKQWKKREEDKDIDIDLDLDA
ncbi:hypothetical protein [Chitinophaga sp. S165]|uniref:hypothetical protein n=1 Tax=Chitinophaga sp. S165 TaxID=2135462 RepID=UPI000D718C40|nr:hypothetical protein [Chitinophaga sp. S165]PWV54430.1 hypothetical protein C7475_1021188 [Chitinophaga sp. S165]